MTIGVDGPAQPDGATPRKRDDMPRSVTFAFTVLEAVADDQPVSLGDLTRTLHASKSTTLRALRALRACGYLAQDGQLRWALTLRPVRLARAATAALGLRDAARAAMVAANRATGEAVHLNVLQGRDVVVVEKVDSSQAVRAYTELGAVFPAHVSSSGKVLLASLSEVALTRFLAEPLKALSKNSITDADTLRVELKKVQLDGYAINNGERRDDVVGFAAPVRDSTGETVAAIGISVPRHRATPRQRKAYITAAQQAALETSKRLGWDAQVPVRGS
jgi:DNA-binding IclR family transcriptional regulator